jgi:hypothetical protein
MSSKEETDGRGPDTRSVHTVRLGVSIGIIWSLSVVLLAGLAKASYASIFFRMIQEVYVGCDYRTGCGLLLCALFGFVDGFIGGALVGLLYNNLPIDY